MSTKDLNVFSQIADLKEVDYRNTLAIASMIEVLIDKGLVSRRDIARKAQELEDVTTEEIALKRARSQ